MKIALNKLVRAEKGQALLLVMIFMLVGGLIIAPLLGFMSTGLITSQVFEKKADELYAADAGVEDALWQIRFDQLTTVLTSPSAYDIYDYTTIWDYALSEQINDKGVDITIENVWIPKDIPAPSETEASDIIEALKLVVTGSIPSALNYQIKINFTPGVGEEDALFIETLGIWLPPGFSYVVGSSNLEADPGDPYYSVPLVSQYAGGQAVVWDFSSGYPFAGTGVGDQFPGVIPGSEVLSSDITFQFTAGVGQSPEALAWVTTSGVSGIELSWDADVKVYKITSIAGDTAIDAYSIRSEMRQLGPAMSGDYFAIGNTLMASTDDQYYREMLFKESSATIATDDDAIVGIPSDATVAIAYLYWSGWLEDTSGLPIWSDDASDFSDWNQTGSDWTTYTSGTYGPVFRGDHVGSEPDRYLTMNSGVVDLSSYVGQTLIVSWDQYAPAWQVDPSDHIHFQFSADGNFPDDYPNGEWFTAFEGEDPDTPFSETIPQEYLTSSFRMRFYLELFFGSGEYAYIDNIEISIVGPPVEDAKVNRIMFNGNQITANESQVAPTTDASGAPDSWAYSSFANVSNVVNQLIEDGDIGANGSGTYTVGHWLEDGPQSYPLYDAQTQLPTGDTTGYPLATPATRNGSYPTKYQWTYAGWSLIIIYSNPQTEGHQLYLFDDLHYVGLNTTLGFPISGFLAPDDTTGSHLTYFVGEGDGHYAGDYIKVNGNYLSDSNNPWNNAFNSYSNVLSAVDNPTDGIDIDRFDMSAYINSGDTSAQIELENGAEIYNLVYIILSFRSEITTGGTLTYLIN